MSLKKGYQGPLAKSANTPPPPLADYNPPKDPFLIVLYEDEDIVVLSKQAGLLCVPGKEPKHFDSLETRAREKWPDLGIVHRLDRGTSGIVIMAKNANAHRGLGLQFEKRKTSKHYVALVEGVIHKEQGKVDLALRTDWYNRPKQMVDTYMGRDAVTHWKVLERGENFTRLELTPITGRSHQLRVHCQHMGHPILGDSFYQDEGKASSFPRMMLHAQMLEITHPVTGEKMEFIDPCPF